MNTFELSWLTGFFEGEGFASCTLQKRKDYGNGRYYKAWVLMSGAAQNDRSPLDEAQKAFGGSIHKKSKNKLSKKTCWEWHISSRLAERFLKKVLPFMRIPSKIKQVEKALRVYSNKGTPKS